MTGYHEFDPQPYFGDDREFFQNWIDNEIAEMKALSRHVEAHRRYGIGAKKSVFITDSNNYTKENTMTARPNFEAIRNEVRNAADAGDLGRFAREISERAEARITEAETYVKELEHVRENYRNATRLLREEREAAVKRVDTLRDELDELRQSMAELKSTNEDKTEPEKEGTNVTIDWTPSDYELRARAVDAFRGAVFDIENVRAVYAFLKGEEANPGRLTVKHDTLDKVYAALPQFDRKIVGEAITAVLNAGVVFRERA